MEIPGNTGNVFRKSPRGTPHFALRVWPAWTNGCSLELGCWTLGAFRPRLRAPQSKNVAVRKHHPVAEAVIGGLSAKSKRQNPSCSGKSGLPWPSKPTPVASRIQSYGLSARNGRARSPSEPRFRSVSPMRPIVPQFSIPFVYAAIMASFGKITILAPIARLERPAVCALDCGGRTSLRLFASLRLCVFAFTTDKSIVIPATLSHQIPELETYRRFDTIFLFYCF